MFVCHPAKLHPDSGQVKVLALESVVPNLDQVFSCLRCFPCLKKLLSDVGFRQTLKVRTLGCARSLSLLPIYALARLDLADELDELATQKDTGFILVRATVVV